MIESRGRLDYMALIFVSLFDELVLVFALGGQRVVRTPSLRRCLGKKKMNLPSSFPASLSFSKAASFGANDHR